MRGLVETPFDAKRSMFDVTTVMIRQRIRRILRSLDASIDDTGTNHDQFADSVLIGGKGIRGGLVIGESDFDDATARLSRHTSCSNPTLESRSGRPFDFKTVAAAARSAGGIALGDYLTMAPRSTRVARCSTCPKRIIGSSVDDLPGAGAPRPGRLTAGVSQRVPLHPLLVKLSDASLQSSRLRFRINVLGSLFLPSTYC